MSSDLRNIVKDKKVYYGKDITIRMLKTGKIQEVYVASNCPEKIKRDLRHYCNLANVKLNEMEQNNEELGSICKKPFSVSVLSY